jgi:hypothetical protein
MDAGALSLQVDHHPNHPRIFNNTLYELKYSTIPFFPVDIHYDMSKHISPFCSVITKSSTLEWLNRILLAPSSEGWEVQYQSAGS